MLSLRKPWQVWLAFGIGLSLVMAAMAWVSAKVLELDDKGEQALVKAQLEERVRLALWRLDSVAAPIIASEAAQPYFTYRAFYPAEGAYSRMFNELDPGEVLLPSPLLGLDNDVVQLHFQRAPDGTLTSPQVPGTDEHRKAAGDIVEAKRLELLAKRFEALKKTLGAPQLKRLAARLPDARSRPSPGPPVRIASAEQMQQVIQLDNSIANTIDNDDLIQQQQIALNSNEFVQRATSLGVSGNFQSNVGVYNPINKQQRKGQRKKKGNKRPPKQQMEAKSPGPAEAAPAPAEGVMTPLWEGGQLLLARRVQLGDREYLQGAWLDWREVERRLLTSIQDLLPDARLVRTEGDDDATLTARRLASLPVRLDPGEVQAAGVSGLTPLQLSLIIAWAALLLGAFAVGGLMRGALALSERRGAFVSAVTHELRTPLTTFRMYTEMLAGGMVRDEAKQQRYVNTLHAEAERLGHLVENVLAYARLERRPDAAQVERLEVRPMLERFLDHLTQRAEQVDLSLHLRVADDAREAFVMADAAAVERILFNLVDNACKYAAPESEPRELHLEVRRVDSANVGLTVRDFGPGIDAEEAATIFRAFHKSAKKAAQTAPGVGLGLALCQRLAVAMGGQLRLRPISTASAALITGERGARFELTLPLSR